MTSETMVATVETTSDVAHPWYWGVRLRGRLVSGWSSTAPAARAMAEATVARAGMTLGAWSFDAVRGFRAGVVVAGAVR